MNAQLNRAAGVIVALLLSAAAAHAAGMLAAKNGMTLYTFDKDKDGVSACYDECAAMWPPYVGKEGETMEKDWTLVKRTDGTMQWAYDGKPLYFYKDDTKAGDAKGDGMNDVWHVVKED